MTDLILYSTGGCHLCEQAEKVLSNVKQAYPAVKWEVVDIAEEDELVERYGIRIPVIQLVGAEYDLGWPFTRDDVVHYLKQFAALTA